MRYLLMVLFLAVSIDFYGNVKLIGRDGWYAQVEINKSLFKNSPAVFLIYNNQITNTLFLLEDDANRLFKLNIDDGLYDYVIYDIEKKVLEKGKLDLTEPFKFNIKTIGSDNIEVEINTKDYENIEASLLLSNKILNNKKLTVNKSNIIRFENLGSGTYYRLELTSNNYYKSKGFKTLLKNIALNKPVYGTFTKLPESRFVDDTTPVIRRINDGRLEWYKGMAVSGEVNSSDQYAFINLLGMEELKEIKVYWHAYYYPLKYSFYYSKDGTNWNYIERSTNQFSNNVAGDNTPLIIDDIMTNITAYYIGIIVKKGEKINNRLALRNYLELLEIEAYE